MKIAEIEKIVIDSIEYNCKRFDDETDFYFLNYFEPGKTFTPGQVKKFSRRLAENIKETIIAKINSAGE